MDESRVQELRRLFHKMRAAQVNAAVAADEDRVAANRAADEAERAWRSSYGPLTDAERDEVIG